MSSNATKPRRLPAEERRQQIVQAVLEVVAEHGVPGATVSRIAKAANVSEGTLYVYFESRDEMLMAALDSIFFEMAGLIDASEETDALERLRDIGRRHSRLMKTSQQMVLVSMESTTTVMA